MRIDMGLNGLKFEFFDQGFQFKGVHLLYPALFNIMEKIIDEGPGKDKHPIVQNIGHQPG
jgi:hypothetical protein